MGTSDSSMLSSKSSSSLVPLVCVLFASTSLLSHPCFPLLLSRVAFLFPVSIAFAVVSHTFVINIFSCVVFLLNVWQALSRNSSPLPS